MTLPAHVAIVMDGNGRWAEQRGLKRTAGHRAGIEAARRTVEACRRRSIPMLTLFAFSTENWRRPRAEVGALLKLFAEGFRAHLATAVENGVRVRFVGDLSRFSRPLRAQMSRMEEATAGNSDLIMNVALNYSGRWDIVAAVNRLAAAGADLSELTEEQLGEALAVPQADLVIRTSGELRISNFLLWQAAYAELHFCSAYWPDFGPDELDAALADYAGRERRYGGAAARPAAARRLYG